MLESIAQLPLWQAFVALYLIVMARSNATYWVGRGARAVWDRRTTQVPDAAHPLGRVGSPRAAGLLNRYGPVAVALSYLTIGVQTAIHFTAGAMRMSLVPYVVGAAIGSVAWALIYATIGMAVIEAWFAARAGSWWVALAALAVAVLAWVVWRRARRRLEQRWDTEQDWEDEAHHEKGPTDAA